MGDDDDENKEPIPEDEDKSAPLTFGRMICLLPRPGNGGAAEQEETRGRPSVVSVRQIYDSLQNERTLSAASRRSSCSPTAGLLPGRQTMMSCRSARTPHVTAQGQVKLSRPRESARSLESRSLPMSRASTSLEMYTQRMPSTMNPDLGYVGPRRPASSDRLCERSLSSLDPVTMASSPVNPLSRQCCDVLGPHICHQCTKITRQDTETPRCEQTFPDLQTTEENFATTVLVKHYIPSLTTHQIQNKVAKGEIRGPGFTELLKRIRDPSRETSASGRIRRQSLGKGIAFFTTIRDLNSKIFTGRAAKNIVLNVRSSDKAKKKRVSDSFSESVMPMFVSPRKVKAEASTYRAFYDPPLLPKMQQNAEPSFFAGSDKPYKLPDRLPDELEQTEEGAPATALPSGTLVEPTQA